MLSETEVCTETERRRKKKNKIIEKRLRERESGRQSDHVTRLKKEEDKKRWMVEI